MSARIIVCNRRWQGSFAFALRCRCLRARSGPADG